jgi:hypothetical protein
MTWCVEANGGWLLVFGAWLALAAPAAGIGPAGGAAALPPAAATNAPAADPQAIPAWMEISALATNAAEWADLATIWKRGPEAEASPTENFTAPIEHYANGRVRAVLHAARGAMGNGGLIWSWKVVVDLLTPTGLSDGRIEAESCLYDRNTRRGYCPAAVALVRTNVTVNGTGLYWTMAPQRLQILSNGVMWLQPRPKDSGGTKK